MKHEVKPYSTKEALIVACALGGILIPLRFLTIVVLDDSWIGSMGVLTAVTLIIITLAHKQRLGKFGDMFMRQITKLHKGKRRWLVYTQTGVIFLFAATALYTINEGNTTYYDTKIQVTGEISEMGINNYDDVMRKSSETPIEEHVAAVIQLPTIAFKQFQILAVTAAITDDMMHNWYSYALIFLVVESAEVGILLAITKKYTKREHQTSV